MESRKKVIAIVGTNASGKSALGIELAKQFHGEIISADSRQVFRGLDLGSGKIKPEEMNGIPHHLIDIRNPGEFFSMADFQRLAYQEIDAIIQRKNLPMIVGGTGLYVDSVLDGYDLSDKEPDLVYRAELETYDTPKLYEMLIQLRPDVVVERNNRNRVMRMLERIHDGDEVVPGKSPRVNSIRIGVTWPREILAVRIQERLEKRMQEGMLEEVAGLLNSGVSPEFLIGLGLEYKYLTWYLTGVMPDKDEMLKSLAQASRKFAKRQMTWFRRHGDVVWLDMEKDPFLQASQLIEQFLEE